MADPSTPHDPPAAERPLWWQRELTRQHYATVLGNARQVAATGNEAEVDLAMMEVETALGGLKPSNATAWRRWLAQVRRDLEWRRTILSEAAARAEARHWR
jgi:hypothetical protein